MKKASSLCVLTLGVLTLGILLLSACSLQNKQVSVKGNAADDVVWIVGNKCYIAPGKPGHFHYLINQNQSDNIEVKLQGPEEAGSALKTITVNANRRKYAYCTHRQDQGKILSANII